MNLRNSHEFDPDAIFSELERAAEEMVRTKETADNLSELKKSVLAKLTLDHMKSVKSRTEAETYALADPDYETYVRGMNEAARQANRAQAMYKNRLVLAELRRTEESTRRSLTR